MLELHVLRHAHSSRATAGLRDHLRPLDERGMRDAAALAERLAGRAAGIRQVVCSTAVRARQTFQIVRPALPPGVEVSASDDLYALGREAYYAAAEAHRASGGLLLVGHNPMIERFVAELCGLGRQDFATATWAVIEIRLLDRPIAAGDGVLREILAP